jgi:hypothetical protein
LRKVEGRKVWVRGDLNQGIHLCHTKQKASRKRSQSAAPHLESELAFSFLVKMSSFVKYRFHVKVGEAASFRAKYESTSLSLKHNSSTRIDSLFSQIVAVRKESNSACHLWWGHHLNSRCMGQIHYSIYIKTSEADKELIPVVFSPNHSLPW